MNGWKNKETAKAVSTIYGLGLGSALCARAYSERITPAKVIREGKKVYAERWGLIEPAIDWEAIGESIAADATEWATYG